MSPRKPDVTALADRLHYAAIHLVRRLRYDVDAPLSPAQLSALTTLLKGPLTLGELAAAEKVRPPTVTRMIQQLERDKLVVRKPSPDDGRVSHIAIAARGWIALQKAQTQRVERLGERLKELTSTELNTLARAAVLMERISAD